MECLFYIIFGGLLVLFIVYAIRLHLQDKKILRDLEDHEKKVKYRIRRMDGYWAGAIYRKKKVVFSIASGRLWTVIKALIKWNPKE